MASPSAGAPSYSFPYTYGRISRLSLSLRKEGLVTATCPAPKPLEHRALALMRAQLGYASSEYGRETRILTGTAVTRCRVNR